MKEEKERGRQRGYLVCEERISGDGEWKGGRKEGKNMMYCVGLSKI